MGFGVRREAVCRVLDQERTHMNIIKAYPPNIDQIDAHFGSRTLRQNEMYAYGQAIFNPHGVDIPPWLVAHEAVHAWRQLHPVFINPEDPEAKMLLAMSVHDKVERWWNSYCKNPEFCFAEELVAHAAEYRYYCQVKTHTRIERRLYLTAIAERLVGPLYGNPGRLNVARAKEQIKKVVADSEGE